ncbi:hypothetical protein K458DRAFT_456809 [Lentithecium fluviatile CBS 122367]|uniref:Uncharacterized protein n=1 Tax=Lentithecium fluviatile CBS 122367 TaxID=1168545 RepID=A0A6G1IUV5_9PLEO|nr:hypothetical protein K458DRAFT_456809 [Lentithecium fluviatile CBS 122367]
MSQNLPIIPRFSHTNIPFARQETEKTSASATTTAPAAPSTPPQIASPRPSRSPSRPLLRPFARKSSDVTNLTAINASLHQQITALQSSLTTQTALTNSAARRAQCAEEREAYLESLARKFWKDEWSGMKDYVSLFNNREASRDIEEIEQRVLREYGALFGAKDREESMGGHGDGKL